MIGRIRSFFSQSRSLDRILEYKSYRGRMLRMEMLEERRMLAVATVSTTSDVFNGDTSSIANLIASDGGDGISLREAIAAANNTGGLDTIEFNIPGGGVQTIQPTSELPPITDSIVIDGYTQPGAAVNTNNTSMGLNTVLTIQLDGTSAGAGSNGLVFVAGSNGSTIRGLSIGNFDLQGIVISGSDNSSVTGNFLGVAPDGVTPIGNGGFNNAGAGVMVTDGSTGTRIGGLTPNMRNLISNNHQSGVDVNNASGTILQGNLIGTDAAGTSAIGNIFSGVKLRNGANQSLIGHQSDPAGRNVISGNLLDGVVISVISTTDNLVAGNYIGVDVSGLAPLGNQQHGVAINGAKENFVGGPGEGGNLIAFNGGSGVQVGDGSATAPNNRVEGNTIRDNGENGVVVNAMVEGARITRNSIHNNTQLGIDLGSNGVTLNDPQGLLILGNPVDTDEGPNRLQNFPSILDDVFVDGGAVTISYSVLSDPASSDFPLTVEFFLADSENQEGQTFVGADTYNYVDPLINPGGQLKEFVFVPQVPISALSTPGAMIVATATDLQGNTSEFSLPASIVLGSPPPDDPGGQPGGPGENDTIETSTLLGSEPAVTLAARIQTALPLIEDIDFYKYTAHSTGKLIVNALFDHDGGDIDLQIVDMDGIVLGESNSTTDNENVIIPVVGQEMYFIRLAAGEDTVFNSYVLEIENFPAPVPTGVNLDPASDTGMMNNDNVTSDVTPTFFIQTDVLEFVDADNNGLADADEINVLTAAEAAAGMTDGIAVEVTLVNTTNSTFVRSFADPLIAIFPEVYSFTPTVPLAGGVYLVTARTVIFDGQGDDTGAPTPAIDRSGPSEPLWVTIAAASSMQASLPDLLSSSDSGMFDDDNVTNVDSPAFVGVAPANYKVRLYANGELVGQSVVGSDTSDVSVGGVGGLGGANDDGLGLWEITSEPLDDGIYEITAEFEDAAGNVFSTTDLLDPDEQPLDQLVIEIDTNQPNTPFLDLLAADDSGRSNIDNTTFVQNPRLDSVVDDPNGPDVSVANPNGHLFAENVKYRIYDRFDTLPEALIFNQAAFVANGGYQNLVALINQDGTHGLKLEVEDRAGNLSHDYLLDIELDRVPPPVSFGLPGVDGDGLVDLSDSGNTSNPGTFTDLITNDGTPRLWGQAEADSIVRVYVDFNGNGMIDPGVDVFLGQDTAIPLDGNQAEPDGYWEIDVIVDLDDPLFFTPGGGLRSLLVSAEDVPGNVNNPGDLIPVDPDQQLDIFIDRQGPQVESVTVTDNADYDLFDPKPSVNGPTPLIKSIDVEIIDFPARLAPDFVYGALETDVALSPGNYSVVGDHVGNVAIESVAITASSVADGQPASATVTITFVDYLPDDRFTFTVNDSIVDPVGNHLDGESNAVQPLENPFFPSGDGLPGGDFVARFTVDSRPEIGTYVAQNISIDINGNFVWDPANGQIGNDATNVDLSFTLPVADAGGAIGLGGYNVHDLLFAGKFSLNDQGLSDGFDTLAAFGHSAELGSFRWIVDRNHDGVVSPALGDILTPQPVQVTNFNVSGAIPVAGNFDGIAANGDEIGLYFAGQWALDSNRNFVIDAGDTFLNGNLLGHPIVGDFDGNGIDDLAVFNSNVLSFGLNLSPNSNIPDLIWGFPGVLDKPVAADMDQDGIDDIGLWIPRDSSATPPRQAEWYFLQSDTFDAATRMANFGTINLLNHPFTPVPFGNDLYAEFGDDLALPIVGNFDPPVATQSVTPQGGMDGDYDGDGDVDGRDFLAWQRSFGSSENLAADGDHSGEVDAGDLVMWSDNYGDGALAPLSSGSEEGGESSGVGESLSLASLSVVVNDPPTASLSSDSDLALQTSRTSQFWLSLPEQAAAHSDVDYIESLAESHVEQARVENRTAVAAALNDQDAEEVQFSIDQEESDADFELVLDEAFSEMGV